MTDEDRERQQARERIMAGVAEVWKGSRPKLIERLEALFELMGWVAVDPLARNDARDIAHALAGTLGTFGLPEGSRLARQVEQRLVSPESLTQVEVLPLIETLERLRAVLGAD